MIHFISQSPSYPIKEHGLFTNGERVTGIVKGYKAFGPDLECSPGLNFQRYAVGEEYWVTGHAPVMCVWGIHFCTMCGLVFHFYPPSAKTRVCEVETVEGAYTWRKDMKCVTDRLRIVRELSRDEILGQMEVYERALHSMFPYGARNGSRLKGMLMEAYAADDAAKARTIEKEE